jgi:YHS domain-containing protein
VEKPIKTYGALFLTAGLIAVSGAACSHPATEQPYDSVVVDRSNPQHTVVEFNGACAGAVQQGRYDIPGKKEYSVTRDNKTYYFSSVQARDNFMRNYADNSRKADEMWLARAQIESGKSTADSSIH